METAVKEPVDAELHLLTDWQDPGAGQRHRRALVGTVLVHAAAICILLILPDNFLSPPAPKEEVAHLVTPLIEPLTPLTQKAPNQGKVMHEFETRASAPRPRVQLPAPPPTPKQTPRPAVIPAGPPPKAAPPAPLPDAPKIETARQQPTIDLPQVAQTAPPPPPPRTVEQPKLQLENVPGPPKAAGPAERYIPPPGSSISEAIRQTARGYGLGGKTVIGDAGAFDPNPYGSINQPPSPGVQGAGVELMTDTGGVDFRPYLTQVLAAVRRNWMAVWPESVRMGLRGRVSLEIAISRDGAVMKLVYGEHSGSRALDEAAVAGVSGSNPFPPLPTEYRGERIVIRLNFVYNMPRK
jgi:TonB family protein